MIDYEDDDHDYARCDGCGMRSNTVGNVAGQHEQPRDLCQRCFDDEAEAFVKSWNLNLKRSKQ